MALEWWKSLSATWWKTVSQEESPQCVAFTRFCSLNSLRVQFQTAFRATPTPALRNTIDSPSSMVARQLQHCLHTGSEMPTAIFIAPQGFYLF